MDPFNKKQLNYRSYYDTFKVLYQKPVAQTSTALIMTLITITFFGMAAIRPTLGTISKLQAELKEKKVIDEQIRAKLSSLAKIQSEYLENKATLGVFDQAISKNHGVTDLLVRLEYIAAENNTPISSMRLAELTTLGPIDEHIREGEVFPSYTIDLSVLGEYTELVNLLDKMVKLDRYTKIETISFSQPNLDEEENLINLGVRLRVYWSGEVVEKEAL